MCKRQQVELASSDQSGEQLLQQSLPLGFVLLDAARITQDLLRSNSSNGEDMRAAIKFCLFWIEKKIREFWLSQTAFSTDWFSIAQQVFRPRAA